MSTPSIPRQQRRKLLRDRLERGNKALARGMPRPFGEDDAVGIALALRQRFGDASNADRASELAAWAEGMLERTLAADTRGLGVACAKGCNHCCRLVVTCTAPEILRVAHWLRQQPGAAATTLIAAVTAAATGREGLTAVELNGQKLPCPMLMSAACGVYAVRPLPCRSLFSMSAQACAEAIDAGTGQVPLVVGALNTTELVRTLMLAALQPLGLSDAGYDLTGGLAAALAMPDAEARWLAGEDVFTSVRRVPRPAKARALQDRLVGLMAALEA